MSKLSLWQSVEKTDVNHVKKAPMGLSAIDGYYVFRLATEMFGPCGIGWGYEITKEEYKEAAPIVDSEMNVQGHTLDHVVYINLWFKQDEETGSIPAIGSTPYLYQTKNGLRSDGEAAKKSLTDAIKKGLSMLGFGADVYMGKFDDQQYVNEIADEQRVEKAVDKEEEIAKISRELVEDAEKVIKQIESAVSLSEVKGLYTAMVRKLNGREKSVERKLSEAKDAAKQKFEEREKQQ